MGYKKILGSLIVSIFACVANAEMSPTPLPGDARLVRFDFDPDNTYLILSKPSAVTHIEFPSDEEIETIASLDTTNFDITASKYRRILFVKPHVESISTSMTVITDKRSYQFVIRSTSDGSKWYQRVSWRIPSTFVFDEGGQQNNGLAAEKVKQAQSKPVEVAAGIEPERLSYEYEISGDAPFRPSVVSDDGVKTYIKLPKGLQELPVLFAVQDGQFTLVNYSVRGDYLIVQLVQDVFILKIGRKEVKISKKAQEKSVVDTFKNILGGG